MSNVVLGVALYPDQPTTEAAIAIGREFVGQTGSPPWCELLVEPYCLLYQATFSRDIEAFSVHVVREIAAEAGVVETALGEFGIQDGHLTWIVSRDEWQRLRQLQAQVLQALAPHRAAQSVILPNRFSASNALRENLERFGYRYCGDLYVPQVRFAYLPDLTSAMTFLHRLTASSRACRFERVGTVALSPETGGLWTLSQASLVA
jgi:hypothetical protein